MNITIHQIQSLLSTYLRQQVQSRLSDAAGRHSRDHSGPQEDRVFLSAEAKRMQIYQKTAEEVLKRLKSSTGEDQGGERSLAAAGRAHNAPPSDLHD